MPAATRNYVIFGLAFVVASVLAVRAWLSPSVGRGQPDAWLRVLVVTNDVKDLASALDEHGLNALQRTPTGVIEDGRSLLDADASELDIALAYADEHGYGFLAIAQDDFELSYPGVLGEHARPPDAHTESPFLVFSVGDRTAPNGGQTRAAAGPIASAPLYDRPIPQFDSLRLALFGHPDFLALWEEAPGTRDTPAHQARQVLEARKVLSIADALRSAHEGWVQLARGWTHDDLGSEAAQVRTLTPPWTAGEALPIIGGALVLERPAKIIVQTQGKLPESSLRKTFLRTGYRHTPRFASTATAELDSCAGLPERFAGQAQVSADGRRVLLGHGEPGQAELWTFTHEPGSPCAAELSQTLDTPVAGRVDDLRVASSGKLAWIDLDDGSLRWMDASTRSRLPPPTTGTRSGGRFSSPRWLDGELLVVLGEHPREAPEFDFDTALHVVGTEGAGEDGSTLEPVRAHLRLDALWTEADRGAERVRGLELAPAGLDRLLVLTRGCALESPRPGARPGQAAQPCLHLLRTEDGRPLGSVLREAVAAVPDPSPEAVGGELRGRLHLETFGAIGPYTDLGFAPDGSALAWTDDDGLMLLELPNAASEDAALTGARRVSALSDLHRPRLSLDGAYIYATRALELPSDLATDPQKAPRVDVALAFARDVQP